jgi:hypothetical protein
MAKTTAEIVTAALQVAIAAKKASQPVNKAVDAARAALWREYTPESQRAAFRAIMGLYGFDANGTPLAKAA